MLPFTSLHMLYYACLSFTDVLCLFCRRNDECTTPSNLHDASCSHACKLGCTPASSTGNMEAAGQPLQPALQQPVQQPMQMQATMQQQAQQTVQPAAGPQAVQAAAATPAATPAPAAPAPDPAEIAKQQEEAAQLQREDELLAKAGVVRVRRHAGQCKRLAQLAAALACSQHHVKMICLAADRCKFLTWLVLCLTQLTAGQACSVTLTTIPCCRLNGVLLLRRTYHQQLNRSPLPTTGTTC